MAQTTATANIGFLTILHEPNGYVGGYLVTNTWGRPLEFRLSTAVQPNRVQQVLYGDTLEPFLYADLIGKTLVEKTATPAQLVLTDCAPALELRHKIESPVAWVMATADHSEPAIYAGEQALPAGAGRGPVVCHHDFPGDVVLIHDLLERLVGSIDLTEPFARIREAIGEARKMGVAARAA